MCFHDVPHYYDKEVQFVILLSTRHLNNTTNSHSANMTCQRGRTLEWTNWLQHMLHRSTKILFTFGAFWECACNFLFTLSRPTQTRNSTSGFLVSITLKVRYIILGIHGSIGLFQELIIHLYQFIGCYVYSQFPKLRIWSVWDLHYIIPTLCKMLQ